MNENGIVTVIQARTGSSRLPGKVLLQLYNKPLLSRMYERVRNSAETGIIVIATTTLPEDDPIEEFCKSNRINLFRGSTDDLLDRHYKAALAFNAEHVVKIPSDCPLIDPKIISKVLNYYLENRSKYDYVSNLHPATYPDGNDVEVMSIDALKNAWKNADRNFEREHTTPYFWENQDKFRIGNVTWETGLNLFMSHRFTIDYPEDYLFIKTVYERLYPHKTDFGLDDILDLLQSDPEILNINRKYAGVNWYRNHLDELKTISEDETKQL